MIVSELKHIINSLGLDHFPTHNEMIEYFGNRALTNKISKSGGTKYWAEVIGYPVKKDCESEFGDYFEIFSIQDIKEHTGFESYKNKVGYPYDITTNKHIKVDVKSSSIIENNQGYKYHSFNLEKKEPTCDLFILYCVDEENKIYKTYIIPSCCVYGQTQIGISAFGISKWDKFIDRWSLFITFNKFYEKITKA